VKLIREGKFRDDLFYRLNVFPITAPPLRERSGDLPLLVKSLVAGFAARVGRRIESVGMATMDRLTRYPWPGNVGELENILERAVILSNGPTFEIVPTITRCSLGIADELARSVTAWISRHPMRPGAIGDRPGFLPCHQTFENQKIGEYVKL
jgi:transcriptional regulator with PAS, ATPase and Fis domain